MNSSPFRAWNSVAYYHSGGRLCDLRALSWVLSQHQPGVCRVSCARPTIDDNEFLISRSCIDISICTAVEHACIPSMMMNPSTSSSTPFVCEASAVSRYLSTAAVVSFFPPPSLCTLFFGSIVSGLRCLGFYTKAYWIREVACSTRIDAGRRSVDMVMQPLRLISKRYLNGVVKAHRLWS